MAWDAYEQEIAILGQKNDKESEEYKKGVKAAQDSYDAKVKLINDSYAQITATVAGAYAQQNVMDSDFFEKLKTHNDAVIKENQRWSDEQLQIKERFGTEAFGLSVAMQIQEKEHQKKLDEINQQLADSFDDNAQEIVGTLLALVGNMQENNGQITDDTREFAKEFLACYDSLPEDLQKQLGDLRDALDSGFQDATETMESAEPKMTFAAKRVFENMSAEFNQLPESAATASENAVKGIIGPFESKENKKKMKTATKGFIKLIPDASEEELDENSPSKVMQRIGGYAIDGLVNGMNEKKPTVINSIGGIMQSMLTAAGSVSFTEVGRNVIGGIMSGLDERKASLMETAGSIAAGISEKIRSALKINSPSKVMIPVGEAITEGMELGLEHGAASLYNTASAISNETAEALGELSRSRMSSVVYPASFGSGDKLDRLLDAVEKLADSQTTMEIDGRPFGRLEREYV